MAILAKIRALFTHKEEPQEMRLAAAEIRGNKVFLHPADDADTTICIKASAVDLHINPEGEVKERDFAIFRKHKTQKQKAGKEQQLKPGDKLSNPTQTNTPSGSNQGGSTASFSYKSPMKTVSFRVYPEEYDSLMEIINSNGYRKAEYLLACVHAAKKKSMETVYNQYYDAHRERRKADRAEAKRLREMAQVRAGG